MWFNRVSVSDSFFGGFDLVEYSILVFPPTEMAQPIIQSINQDAITLKPVKTNRHPRRSMEAIEICSIDPSSVS